MAEFFEKQNDRDCTIHSLNNAVGHVVITKQQVLDRIERLTKQFSETHTPEETKHYRGQMAAGDSFFSAETVWDTAKELGTIGTVSPIPGFGGDFANLETLPSWVLGASLVFLGLDAKGHPHAIAARDGKIYDSQKWANGPKPLTNAGLSKSMNRVFALFIVTKPDQDRITVTRLQPTAMSSKTKHRSSSVHRS